VQLLILASQVLNIVLHLFVLKGHHTTRVAFDALTELFKLSLEFYPVLSEISNQSLKLLDLRFFIHVVDTLANGILDELVVVIILNEGLQVFCGCLRYSVQVDHVVSFIVDFLNEKEALLSESDRFAFLDDVVPTGHLVAVDSFLE
jgi:hypothetical protein